MLFYSKRATEKGVLLKTHFKKLALSLTYRRHSTLIVPLFLEIVSGSKPGFEFKLNRRLKTIASFAPIPLHRFCSSAFPDFLAD